MVEAGLIGSGPSGSDHLLGYLVFAVMGVAVWALLTSMNRHMGPIDFERVPEGGVGEAEAGSPAAQEAGRG